MSLWAFSGPLGEEGSGGERCCRCGGEFGAELPLTGPIDRHLAPPLPVIGGGQPLREVVALLEHAPAAMVLIDGKPRGVLTRQDLLAHLGAR